MTRKQLLAAIGLLMTVAFPAWADPVPVGQNSRITLDASYFVGECGPYADGHFYSRCAQTANSLGDPLAPVHFEQVDGTHGNINAVDAWASQTANSLHSAVRVYENYASNGAGEGILINTLFDTYTIHSSDPTATGPVDFTISVGVHGTGGPSPDTAQDKFVRWEMVIGARNTDPSADDKHQVGGPVGSLYGDGYGAPCITGVNPPGCPVDALVDATVSTGILTRDLGTPFELGYSLILDVGNAYADFGNTATINFDLPTGYFITSAAGWTDPTLATGIPAPAGIGLFIVGLAGLHVLRRWRA